MPVLGTRFLVDGVARDLLDVPPTTEGFDLLASSYDNAGNTIHAESPFSLWDDGSGALIDGRRLRHRTGMTFGESVTFANKHADKFLLSAANFIQFGGLSEARRAAYRKLRDDLARLEIPLVVLGLGVQAPRRWNPRDHQLPLEAIELLELIGEKSKLVSVRGEFSASILRDYAGVRNVFVTGCPSFFQRPRAFGELRQFLRGDRRGAASFSITNLAKPAELDLLRRAVRERQLFVDVHDGPIAAFVRALAQDPELAPLPDVLRTLIDGSDGTLRNSEVRDYFRQRSRRFSRARQWIQTVQDEVRFSWGTRLHANMATMLAGRPALWVAHDTRTIEATNALYLPAVTLSDALKMSTGDLERSVDYEPMFDQLHTMFRRFNLFLGESGLPEVDLHF